MFLNQKDCHSTIHKTKYHQTSESYITKIQQSCMIIQISCINSIHLLCNITFIPTLQQNLQILHSDYVHILVQVHFAYIKRRYAAFSISPFVIL